jgi:hypothetical protein
LTNPAADGGGRCGAEELPPELEAGRRGVGVPAVHGLPTTLRVVTTLFADPSHLQSLRLHFPQQRVHVHPVFIVA